MLALVLHRRVLTELVAHGVGVVEEIGVGAAVSDRDHGVITQLSRRVYRLASIPDLGAPDLVTVSTRIPR